MLELNSPTCKRKRTLSTGYP